MSGLSDEEQNLKRVLEKTAKYNSVDKHHKLVLITKVAAGFAIMLLISFFFLYYTHTNSTVLNHYNFQSVCDIFPSENDLYLKNIVHSITLLRQGETNVTRDSAEHFVLKHGKEMEILKLSDAVTNLENSNLAQARTRLEKLITSDHQEVKISALWYYSLLCIKEEKESEALQIIRRLTKEKNYYSEKADSLINFIKRE